MPPRKKRASNGATKNDDELSVPKRIKSTSVEAQSQLTQTVSNGHLDDTFLPDKTSHRKKSTLQKKADSKADRSVSGNVSASGISKSPISSVKDATLSSQKGVKYAKRESKRKEAPANDTKSKRPLTPRNSSVSANERKKIKSEIRIEKEQTISKKESLKVGVEKSLKSEKKQQSELKEKPAKADKVKNIKLERERSKQQSVSKKATVKAEQQKSKKCVNEKVKNKAKVLIKKINLKEEHNLDNKSNLNNLKSGDEQSKKASMVKLLLKADSSGIEDGTSSSESEWEDVEEGTQQDLDDYKPEIPKEGVEITIDCPDLNIRTRKKKKFDEMDYIRLYVNRMRKREQLNIHKMHLLCLLAHGLYVNNILNSSDLKALALSYIPVDLLKEASGQQINKINCKGVDGIARWFRSAFSFEKERSAFVNIAVNLPLYFETRTALNASEYNLMFIVVARTLGFKTRFCISLYPVTHKALNLIKKPADKKNKDIADSSKAKKAESNVAGPSKKKNVSKQESNKKQVKAKAKECKLKVQKPKNQKSRPERCSTKSYKLSSCESGDETVENDEDEYIVSEEERKSRRSASKTPRRKSNRSVLSSDSAPSSPEASGFRAENIICWAEVFLKAENQWVSVDCVNNFVNKPYTIEGKLLQPVTHILAFDDNSCVKDITRRYCSNYMTSTVRLRADEDWWEETLFPFLPPYSKLDKEEEKDLENMLTNKPLPNTVSGFKNHPLYALKRHLLKFEAIYPPDAAPVGFLKKEAVYARQNICQLHSRETWLKEARVVRIGEEAYKVVKARPKWDRVAGVVRTDIPLDIFGFWQTEPYEPPIAVDGKVPRNEYGNVELFKACMLPKGTVHLQLPGLNRIAKKLGIDCCAAVVGFDGHKGSIHPVFDGFIVCEEFKETMLEAWEEEQENARKREEEKREKRIYGNWRKLIRGLLIRERIKVKYDVK